MLAALVPIAGIPIEAIEIHDSTQDIGNVEARVQHGVAEAGAKARIRTVARVFVAVDEEPGAVGFCSPRSYTLAIADLPEAIAKKLPRYDAIRAALTGRLARDVRARGRGIGELLLADAIRRILGAARSVAVFAIVIDAKDEAAAEFYRRFGFRPFPNRPLRLFMPSAVAGALERT